MTQWFLVGVVVAVCGATMETPGSRAEILFGKEKLIAIEMTIEADTLAAEYNAMQPWAIKAMSLT